MIPFNIPPFTGYETKYMEQSLKSHKICGDGEFTKKCSHWMESRFDAKKVLLTTSCTHALELSAMLCGIDAGDEVIMPSYTFVSTANAFVLRGAKIVFVDIRPDTMNIDEKLIESAITPKTKAIVPVHYSGIGCHMEKIMDIAKHYGLYVIEDAAQGVNCLYDGRALGTIGDLGCYSFHETKNYSMGEGGALVINNDKFMERAEILREKGTDRSRFLRGQVDKYSWVDVGSSYLPSELNAAHLYAQLEQIEEIDKSRLSLWEQYEQGLYPLKDSGLLEIQTLPELYTHNTHYTHNAHMFYIKTKYQDERSLLISHLQKKGIGSAFHYIPLHSSYAGLKYSRFHGKDRYTTNESDRLLRLPMYYGLSDENVQSIINAVRGFYES